MDGVGVERVEGGGWRRRGGGAESGDSTERRLRAQCGGLSEPITSPALGPAPPRLPCFHSPPHRTTRRLSFAPTTLLLPRPFCSLAPLRTMADSDSAPSTAAVLSAGAGGSTAASAPPHLQLYDFWRSGSAWRVRIALNLKGLSFTRHPINLTSGEQMGAEYGRINCAHTVPTLVVSYAETQQQFVLSQSPAILEWLEETHPQPPLLPKDASQRSPQRHRKGGGERAGQARRGHFCCRLPVGRCADRCATPSAACPVLCGGRRARAGAGVGVGAGGRHSAGRQLLRPRARPATGGRRRGREDAVGSSLPPPQPLSAAISSPSSHSLPHLPLRCRSAQPPTTSLGD